MANEQVKVFYFEEADPRRLDQFLVECLPDFSRSRLQRLIRDGLVSVGNAPAQKTGLKLEGAQTVRVRIPPLVPSELIPEDLPLDVVFENGDVLVVNKPAGMVVHPSAGHTSGTLVHAALGHAPDIEGVGGELRPGVVHRLDKNTSGLILLAKSDKAHRFLQAQFKGRRVEKTYLALVDGTPPTPAGRVDAPIGRDPVHRKYMAVVRAGKGREAITEYKTLERFPYHSLLEAHPLTGRTHQIRVHLAFLRCPVVGDTVYGRRKPTLPIERHFLHAARLRISLPGETAPRSFEAPLPEELSEALGGLRV